MTDTVFYAKLGRISQLSHGPKLKLNDVQKRILHAVLLRANSSVQEISRLVGVKEATVRRSVSQFLDHGIFLRRSIFVDPHALGLNVHVAQLSVPSASKEARDEFVALLCRQDEVGAVAEMGMGGEYEIRVLTQGVEHLWTFFDSLTEKSKSRFVIRSCLPVMESEYFGKVPGAPLASALPGTGFKWRQAGARTHELDEKDHVLLSGLANDRYLHVQEVCRSLGMSASSVQYRLEKLEARGVILGHFYVLDPKLFGDMPFVMQLTTKALTAKERVAISAYCQVHPLISSVTFFLGSQSAEMYVLAPTFDGAQSALASLSTSLGSAVESIHLRPQLAFHKFSLYPFKRFVIAEHMRMRRAV